jgi:hypothetical protein
MRTLHTHQQMHVYVLRDRPASDAVRRRKWTMINRNPVSISPDLQFMLQSLGIIVSLKVYDVGPLEISEILGSKLERSTYICP